MVLAFQDNSLSHYILNTSHLHLLLAGNTCHNLCMKKTWTYLNLKWNYDLYHKSHTPPLSHKALAKEVAEASQRALLEKHLLKIHKSVTGKDGTHPAPLYQWFVKIWRNVRHTKLVEIQREDKYFFPYEEKLPMLRNPFLKVVVVVNKSGERDLKLWAFYKQKGYDAFFVKPFCTVELMEIRTEIFKKVSYSTQTPQPLPY